MEFASHNLLALEDEHYEVLYQDPLLTLVEEGLNPGRTNTFIS